MVDATRRRRHHARDDSGMQQATKVSRSNLAVGPLSFVAAANLGRCTRPGSTLERFPIWSNRPACRLVGIEMSCDSDLLTG